MHIGCRFSQQRLARTEADHLLPVATPVCSDLTSVVGDITGIGGTIASGATSVFGDATSAVVGFGETVTSVFPSVFTQVVNRSLLSPVRSPELILAIHSHRVVTSRGGSVFSEVTSGAVTAYEYVLVVAADSPGFCRSRIEY